MLSSTARGDLLESRVHDLLQAEIDADRFWVKKDNCRVFHKKGYYSKDRGKEIVFDVSIELYLPGATEYSALVLVECKNYAHAVPVDDIEEFFAKVQQVAAANAKAVVASTSSFQSGARAFAKSKGVGLMRYFESGAFKWELKRSASASARFAETESAISVAAGLSRQDFESAAFDLYMQSPVRETNSLWSFFEDIARASGFAPFEVDAISNMRSKIASQVPFLDAEEFESQSVEILSLIGYSGGGVALDKVCELERERTGLVVNFDVRPHVAHSKSYPLGRIQFDPLIIDVYIQDGESPGRTRFTLGHELAHHFLRHGQYLIQETCDDSDFFLKQSLSLKGSDVARMEYQANFLAACILLPRVHVGADFRYLLRQLNVIDKGFGALYVDDQACNLRNYEIVTSQLMKHYDVSRQAVAIRLESLGLLHDARKSSFQSVSQIFGA